MNNSIDLTHRELANMYLKLNRNLEDTQAQVNTQGMEIGQVAKLITQNAQQIGTIQDNYVSNNVVLLILMIISGMHLLLALMDY